MQRGVFFNVLTKRFHAGETFSLWENYFSSFDSSQNSFDFFTPLSQYVTLEILNNSFLLCSAELQSFAGCSPSKCRRDPACYQEAEYVGSVLYLAAHPEIDTRLTGLVSKEKLLRTAIFLSTWYGGQI